MKDILIGVFIFIAVLCIPLFWSLMSDNEKEQLYYCEVIFNNGDRYNVVIRREYPKVLSTGCMWDGGSYICGVRQIIKIDTIK